MLSLFFKIYHTVRRWCYFIAKAVKFWGYALHFPCYIMFFTTKAGFWKSLFFKWSNVTVVTNGYCVYLFIVRYQQLHCNMRIKNKHIFLFLWIVLIILKGNNTMHAYIINALRMPIGTLMWKSTFSKKYVY